MNTVPFLMKDNIVSVHFDGMMELMEFDINSIPNISFDNVVRFNRLMKETDAQSGGDWYGPTNANNQQVINHALIGDGDLYTTLTGMVAEIDSATGVNTITYQESITRPKRARRFGAFGDEMDIHKVYQGKCDSAWERRVRVPSNEEHSLVTIYVDIGGLGKESAILSLWRAAAVVKLVRDYEAAGKSIRVIVGGAVTGAYVAKPLQKLISTHSIIVKGYKERLSLERLAGMSHLGFHRTFGFAARLCQPHKVDVSMGHTLALRENVLSIGIQEEIAEGKTKVVIVPRCTNLSSAINAINRVYADLKNINKSGRETAA